MFLGWKLFTDSSLSLRDFCQEFIKLRVIKWFNLFRCISGNFSKKKGKIYHVCFILDTRSCLPQLQALTIIAQDIWPVWISSALWKLFSSPLTFCILMIVSELLKMMYSSLLGLFVFFFLTILLILVSEIYNSSIHSR